MDNSADLYDEFGNYIGPEISDTDSVDDELYDGTDSFRGSIQTTQQGDTEMNEESTSSNTTLGRNDISQLSRFGDLASEMMNETSNVVIPHEEKQYYPPADAVYPEAEVLVQEEDTEPITQPIIAAKKVFTFDLVESKIPQTRFSFAFLTGLMSKPSLIRSVCLIGNLHHGKTHFMNMLVKETHYNDTSRFQCNAERSKTGCITNINTGMPPKYTDTRMDEQERGLSIKATPMTLVMQSSMQKSYLLNVYDTPGHPCFLDDAAAAMALCDGAVLVVDALEGVMSVTSKILQHALRMNLDVTLVLTSIDRLILELRIPPVDAYHKIRHTIEELNNIIENCCEAVGRPIFRLNPLSGNVIFASGINEFCFTLKSFARIYAAVYGELCDEDFSQCLWGDVYFNNETRTFTRTPPDEKTPRTFVEFVLNPLYKLFSNTVSEERDVLEPILHELGIQLKPSDYTLDTKNLLRRVCNEFFGGPCAFVDMLVEHVSSPEESAARYVKSVYTGSQDGEAAHDMRTLNTHPDSLMVYTTKNYHRPDQSEFDVFGRVLSGTIRRGQKVRVLGEAFSLDDDEDMVTRNVTGLWIFEGRYRIEVDEVTAGNWVLIGGVDPSISKSSTITSDSNDKEVEIFRQISFCTNSVVKVACEPLSPSELPKMLEGLRRINKSYPLAKTKVEESGEHVVIGTGELYMDSIFHDLRKLYGDLEIKVADPVAQFCETVVESSTIKCFAETPNKKNKICLSAEPLEKGIAEDIEDNLVSTSWEARKLGDYFTTKHNWDLLASRSVWAFGPDDNGPNILLDDTLPTEVNKPLLGKIKDSIIQGFQWATKEGPLIEEAVRNVKFKILNANIAEEPINRGGGQIIPTARRVVYSSFLVATPRLMEPVFFSEIQCPADCMSAIYNVLTRRRGFVSRDLPKPGTPFFIVHAYIPVIESFGFETDIRTHTSGQVFCTCTFDHWAIVPGDPLDKSIVLRPLEPAPAPHLAREFLLKTRRRKGLYEEVSVQKFFDDPMLVELAKQDADLQHYF